MLRWARVADFPDSGILKLALMKLYIFNTVSGSDLDPFNMMKLEMRNYFRRQLSRHLREINVNALLLSVIRVGAWGRLVYGTGSRA